MLSNMADPPDTLGAVDMQFLNLGSISKKLTLMILFAVMPCIAILLYSGIEMRRHLIEDAQSNVLLITNSMAIAQKEITQSTKQILSTLSQLPLIHAMDPNASSTILRASLEQTPNFNNIALVDLKGEVLASGKPFTRANLADRKHVKEALEKHDFVAGEYIVTRVGTAIPAFAFAYPVLDKEGRPKAVLTAVIKLDIFSRFYDISTLPDKAFVAVTDYKGIRLFYYPAQENTNPIGKPIGAKAWNAASKGAEHGLFFGAGSDGLDRIFAYEKVCLNQEDTPYLYVWAGIPKDYILKTANYSLVRNLLIMFLGTVISLFISWMIGKNTLISPIQSLVALTRKFAQGDLEARSELTTNAGEVGMLTKAFYDMAESLAMSRKTLQESEKKYRELTDSLPQVVFEIDEIGNITYTNQNAFNLFLYTKDEFAKGLNITQIIIPEDLDRAIKNMQSVLNGTELGGVEYTAIKSDGTRFPIVIHANLITRNEKPTGLRGLLIDISEQKTMETNLKRRALAIDHSSDTIVITDRDGTIVYVNPAFEKITGYSHEEALGKNPRILQSGSHDKSFYTELWKTITNGKTWSGRFINKKKDGSQYTEDATISPVFSDKGEIVSYVAVKRDVSEQLRLQSQLQQTQKMESIGTLAGGIAHDFNNILFPIVGYTEMLLLDTPEDSPIRESLNQIYTSVLRAKSLVKQILTFSRQGSNELTLMKMQPIIKEALKLIRSTIPTTIEIQQDINPDCGVIKADPTQIHQIVMNLTTNAYHAMEETGGELKVSLKKVEIGEYDIINTDMIPGIYACLTVADTGVGMDKNLRDKIFDPFFTTKELGKGTGMGLSVVHGIVTAMGGAIRVYSKPGKGTEFHVYLPVEKILSEEQATTSKAQIQGGTEQILLVDDEEAILSMEKRMLERLGYQVTSRSSSLEALEAFRANLDKFDLIITDMQMPNMPGEKLSAELIKIRSDIPILLCTGFSETMSEKRAASLGIKGFLLKPIVMNDLAQKIREVLDKK